MQRRLVFPASDRPQKGKVGWMQFYMSSLPYFISPFVKRPPVRHTRPHLLNSYRSAMGRCGGRVLAWGGGRRNGSGRATGPDVGKQRLETFRIGNHHIAAKRGRKLFRENGSV